MNVFILGDISVVTSSTEEYIKSALLHLEPTKVLLDGLSDISIIAAHCCSATKIPYTIVLPAKTKAVVSKSILADSQNIIYYQGSGLSGTSGDYRETREHLAALATIILYVTDYTKHSFMKKTLSFITKSKKPHLIIPA